MRLFTAASARQINLGLATLRLITGAVFIAHGAQKLFVFGLDGVAGAFGQMGIPLAAVAGPAVAFVEFFGGLALVLGLLTRLAALGLGVTMLGALLFVHARNGFFLPGGFEFVLALLGVAATLVVTGAGRYSLDELIDRRTAPAAQEVRPVRRAA